MNLMYDKLEGFFVPVMIYFFASVLVLMLAFLRKSDVDSKSYMLVFYGMLLSIIYEGLSGISAFSTIEVPFIDGLIMLFYGISQYLVVIGILNEVKTEHDLAI